MTLTEFLLARIAEDEAMARAATGNKWAARDHSLTHDDGSVSAASEIETDLCNETGGTPFFESAVSVEYDRDYNYPGGGCERVQDAQHIARHDPARVLADCAARRAIVEMCGPSRCGDADEPEGWREDFANKMGFEPDYHYPRGYSPGCDGCSAAQSTTYDGEQILRHLASVYQSHPDFDPAWRLP